jgi:hypothetical protein
MIDPDGVGPPRRNPRLSATSVDHITHGTRGRRVARWAIGGVFAGVVLVIAGAILVRSQDGTPTTQADGDTAAKALLMDLADRSESQPAVTTDVLPILHETSEGPETTTNVVDDQSGREQASVFLVTSRTEQWWLSPTRVRRIQRQMGDREPLNDAAIQAIATGPPMPDVAFRGVLVERADTMPTVPEGGIDSERERISRTFPAARAEDELFTSLVEKLEDAHADNQLRAGWLRMLASVEGTRVVPDQTDRLGRPGIGVVFTTRSQGVIDHLVILDPTTGALLGLRDTLIAPNGDEFRSPVMRKDVAFTVGAVAAAPPAEIVN